MTFSELTLKMLRANARRYRLYFLCGVCAVTVFYCMAALFTNRYLMNPLLVGPSASSNVYAPSLFAAGFTALFVPYAYRAFMRGRGREYGVLLTLGMRESEALRGILLENGAVALLSLTAGLLLGTVLSLPFFAVVRYGIGITGVRWYWSAAPYGWTAALYGVTLLLTLAGGLYDFAKAKVIDLLQEKFRAERHGRPRAVGFAAGLALTAGAAALCILRGNSNLLLAGMALCYAGFLLLLRHAACLGPALARLSSRLPGNRRREEARRARLPAHSLIRQHGRSHALLCAAAAALIGLCVFFGGLCAVLYGSSVQSAVRETPDGLAFARIFGKNEASRQEVTQTLAANGVWIAAVRELPFLRDRVFNYVPVSAVDRLGADFKVERGQFLALFQFDPRDGYEHDLSAPDALTLKAGNKTLALRSAGSAVRILYNYAPGSADRTLVVSDGDYARLAADGRNFWQGTLELYRFAHWQSSGRGVDAVQRLLLAKNRVPASEQQLYYSATSRFEAVLRAKQASQFLVLLFFFVLALFYLASFLIVHFRIRAEEEETRRVFDGLARIGAAPGELTRLLRLKNRRIHLPQGVIGGLTGAFFLYAVTRFTGEGPQAAGIGLLLGGALFALQLVYVRVYTRFEARRLGL